MNAVEVIAPLRWGILGFGWVAQDFMAPAIAAAGDLLVAVADPDETARAAAAEAGLRSYHDAATLAADHEIDAIYVATPNHLHADAVCLMAAAGKAVLCEKPMATNLTDANRMVAACRHTGVLYRTAFDQRHHPAHRAMRDAIRNGAIGRPTAIRILYACWVGSDWAAPAGRENWRVDGVKAGGGALIDLAPHGLDLVAFLLDEPVLSIAAATQTRVQDYDVDDGAMILGRTASGVLVTLHVAYNCPEALPRRRLEVVGSAGMLQATNTMGQDPGGEVALIDGYDGAVMMLPVPNRDASPFVEQVRSFAQAARRGGGSSADADLHTMALIDLAYSRAATLAPSPAPADLP